MRIATFAMNAQYMTDLDNIMGKYQGLETQLSTGRKLNQPSDNPVGIETDMQSQTELTQVSEWTSNATIALSNMKTTDDAMANLQDVLGSVRTNLIQAESGTNTQSEINDILKNVQQQVEAIAQIGNTSDGQQYIFAGANGSTKPIAVNTSTGQLSWNGGTIADKQLTIGSNVTIETGSNGQQLFNQATNGMISNLNSILNDLNTAASASTAAQMQTSLQSVQTDLSNLDTNIDNVSSMRADLGGRMSRVTSAQTQLSQMDTSIKEVKSSVEDANVAQVMTQLTTQQTVYQAALLAGQHMILPTLADILK